MRGERARDPSLEATSSDGIAEGVVRVVENNGTTRTFAPPILEASATGGHGPVAPAGNVTHFRSDTTQLSDASSQPSVARIYVN